MNLFMKPRRYPRPPREEELLATATPYPVVMGRRTVQAWRWGSDGGRTILLVHGWEGRGAQLAAFVAPLTAAGFTVVAFDAPGHGESDGARSSLPHFAWAVRAVAASCSDLVAVIAHSLGCAATTLAVHEGLRPQRLIYISPPLDPSDYVLRFGDILNISRPVLEGMKRRIEHRFQRSWSDYSLARMAPSMRTPLLVIHDRDDDDTEWEGGAALAERWPGARMVTTQGLGHRRILRDPAVVEAATNFAIAG
jgi:pimeloyl-ACP methyl ester carboxylesterase